MTRYRLLVFALLVIILVLALGSVRLDSTTSDETEHIGCGVIKILHGQLEFFRFQPPLWDAVLAAPMVLDGVRVPPLRSPLTTSPWAIGRYVLYNTGHDAHRLLLLARLPTVAAFLALCLAVYLFVARQTGSRRWGVAALVLTGFCPLLMAHGRLATVDIAATLFMFLGVTLLLRLIERPSIPAAIFLGLASSAAVLSKSSGSILGPLFLLLIVVAFALRRIAEPRRFLRLFALSALAGLVFAEIVILSMASPTYIRSNFPRLDSPVKRLALPVAEGLANVRAINKYYSGGHDFPQFLLGRYGYAGWLHYYPTAILLKTTLPALMLALVGMIAMVRRLPRRDAGMEGSPSQSRFAALVCFVFTGAYLLLSLRSALAIGARSVLPMYPFIYSGAIIAIAEAWRDIAVHRRRIAGIVFVALLTWHAAENLVAYPGYIAYFNQFAGGKANADRLLIDSNLDWGQDLRRLAIWSRENGVREMTIHYFGGSDVLWEMKGIRTHLLKGPGSAPLPQGWFAVSRHFYRLSLGRQVWPDDYETYLRANRARYVTTVGDSILVYRIP